MCCARSASWTTPKRGRFLWPSSTDGVVTITPAQLGYLLEGIDWRMPQHTWRPQAAG
ncbi:IS66 family insertion sequence element accessory protein TnpB [Bradyrhizobium sp. BWC-3-1]|uniref:IS66 family insertion sequence element accessory protein TnpB n=1 Tax=Bradyrhizobium sp. BWC-3-1 TaxID=3080012 RepID=UPI00293E3883|nr:IS66 family insertion sequence element accessory protein TnpB [Bradyrhizobium sp. BWC-3-1]WOH61795.1 IS66 family insertion sequence element accessory protein TnpB [Bradyrhizobium sp. BWC-3-1]